MRTVRLFCGRYSLPTGVRIIAGFYIGIYFVNILLNIFAADMAKSYKEDVDKDMDYDRTALKTFHYICIVFGVVTLILAVAMMKLFNSPIFLRFMIKWSIARCFFVIGAILFVAIQMSHIMTVSLSSSILILDFCTSTYFIGIFSSYLKELDDPTGEVYAMQKRDNKQPSGHLVSHEKATDTSNEASGSNEVAVTLPEPSDEPDAKVSETETDTPSASSDQEPKPSAVEANPAPSKDSGVKKTVTSEIRIEIGPARYNDEKKSPGADAVEVDVHVPAASSEPATSPEKKGKDNLAVAVEDVSNTS